jgi:hypothetical protein
MGIHKSEFLCSVASTGRVSLQGKQSTCFLNSEARTSCRVEVMVGGAEREVHGHAHLPGTAGHALLSLSAPDETLLKGRSSQDI